MFARAGILWLGLAALVHVASSAACVEVNGGAVELSWSLRSFGGTRIEECDDVRIESIRLAWKAAPDGGSGTSLEPDDWETFPCEDSRGITEFSIPAGRQMFWILPLCPGGTSPTGDYEVPPPIVRTVTEGTVITLDALLVVADASTCPAP
jgi:hypothetical protein